MLLFLHLSVGTHACYASVDLIGFSLLIHCLDKIPLFYISLKYLLLPLEALKYMSKIDICESQWIKPNSSH